MKMFTTVCLLDPCKVKQKRKGKQAWDHLTSVELAKCVSRKQMFIILFTEFLYSHNKVIKNKFKGFC